MDHETLLARFHIEPGYYLYKDKFAVDSVDPGMEVTGIDLPQGVRKTDEYFGDIIAFYESFDAKVTLRRADAGARSVSLKLRYQGCAEDGICYPPIEKNVTLDLPGMSDAAAAGTGLGGSSGRGAFPESSVWPVILAFGSGLLLTFTPCVLPMVPILAGIVVGQGGGVTRLRGGGLASIYVLGTAVTYVAIGVVAGLTGEQLQAYFQNVWAIGLVSALLVLMALSMFGLFELRMPSGIQSRLQNRATGLKAGAFGGVFLMGILSALIVGACVSPILISILSLAINRGDPVLGGAIMFAMAMGMGLFLIAMGFGFGHVLPRTGRWMETVNHFFGFMLLAVVIYLLGAFPRVPVMYLWAALFVGAAVYLAGSRASGPRGGKSSRARQGMAVLMLGWGILAVVGGFQGSRDILRPVDASALLGNTQSVEHARFQRVTEPGALQELMRAAGSEGKPVLVDYYADWCVDCVRMEETTFASPEVARTLNEEFVLVQVDVTDPRDPGTSAIKQSHGIFGPPAMLFFDRQGREITSMRRYGYMDSDAFLDHIKPLLNEAM
jgi:thiol:disulfide interchange protein DsbD